MQDDGFKSIIDFITKNSSNMIINKEEFDKHLRANLIILSVALQIIGKKGIKDPFTQNCLTIV